MAFNCSTTLTTLADFSLFNFTHSFKCSLTSHWELFHVFLDHFCILVIFCKGSIQVFVYFSLFSFSSYNSFFSFSSYHSLYEFFLYSRYIYINCECFLSVCGSLPHCENVFFYFVAHCIISSTLSFDGQIFFFNYYICLITATLKAKGKGGPRRMKWLDSITNSVDMTLSKLREIVEDRGAWCASVHGVTKSQTQLKNWIKTPYYSI